MTTQKNDGEKENLNSKVSRMFDYDIMNGCSIFCILKIKAESEDDVFSVGFCQTLSPMTTRKSRAMDEKGPRFILTPSPVLSPNKKSRQNSDTSGLEVRHFS